MEATHTQVSFNMRICSHMRPCCETGTVLVLHGCGLQFRALPGAAAALVIQSQAAAAQFHVSRHRAHHMPTARELCHWTCCSQQVCSWTKGLQPSNSTHGWLLPPVRLPALQLPSFFFSACSSRCERRKQQLHLKGLKAGNEQTNTVQVVLVFLVH